MKFGHGHRKYVKAQCTLHFKVISKGQINKVILDFYKFSPLSIFFTCKS